ncbi:outer membrane beta-barrel protein [Sphingomonas silueang]|uniref:outer membrane beta-barrel protein n=1 Tax=Sphingomonas silueang TaxID=3156617 RepID=UPI0032B480F7
MRIAGRHLAAAACSGPALLAGGVAHAQLNPTLIRTVVLPEFSRDRNQSVTERARPDFDPIGVQVGSFVINPALAVINGVTSNVLLLDADRRTDVYTIYQPTLRAASDWSRHRIALDAAGDFQRYAANPARNQDAGYVNVQGRLDVSNRLIAAADAQVSRVFESPISDDVVVNNTYFSHYNRRAVSLRGIYTGGRIRVTGLLDQNVFQFDDLRLLSGGRRSQATRDRTINRATATVEYGVTPTVAFYGQMIVDDTSYPTRLVGGVRNRDSLGTIALAGVNFDVAGLMRGALGIGYTYRNYRSDRFGDASGVSAQGRVDFFPTELTTVGLSLQRQIQDANLGNGSAYIDKRIGIDADHELLRNLIVSASASRTQRSYFDIDALTNVTLANVRGQFQMTRSLSFGLATSYTAVAPSGAVPFSIRATEWRGQLSMRIRR